MAIHPNIETHSDNLPVLTVSEISQALKRHVEDRFDRVRVRGEISGFKPAASGHLYFVLKDADAVLEGVCWRGTAQGLAVKPEDGLEVIATGRLTTYPGRSRYQMIVEAMEAAGAGALLKLLEDRRQRLTAEGLFDAARKRPIPFLPAIIGVITSPTGAVIRDILHRIGDRCPRRVVVWPVAVQGQGAAEQVAAAVAGFNALSVGGPVPRPDVLIVARGGGSIEDLWAFNEENVVRAVAASRIPVISAVGHETDITLIDHAADRRAPTPSAAAEMAVPVRIELASRLLGVVSRLVNATSRRLAEAKSRVEVAARGLPRPDRLCGEARQRLDEWQHRLRQSLIVGIDRRRAQLMVLSGRLVGPAGRIADGRGRLAAESRMLSRAITTALSERRSRLTGAAALLESYSYQRVLDRGFALVYDRTPALVTTARGLRPGQGLDIRLADGSVAVVVDRPDGPRPARRTGAKDDPDQGGLF